MCPPEEAQLFLIQKRKLLIVIRRACLAWVPSFAFDMSGKDKPCKKERYWIDLRLCSKFPDDNRHKRLHAPSQGPLNNTETRGRKAQLQHSSTMTLREVSSTTPGIIMRTHPYPATSFRVSACLVCHSSHFCAPKSLHSTNRRKHRVLCVHETCRSALNPEQQRDSFLFSLRVTTTA